ncbi:MAG: 16S rRNA (cytosine(1402)-N(4))-methyltransferase RsmH [Bowdeniella nasicola]|nr:16S rRNA (cytosine(1402)-N(4))-methyltransferase RsmH [Bowdeniella nasicola]
MDQPRHVPVFSDRCVELLRGGPLGDGLIIDATLGLGGHAEALLDAAPHIRVLGIDRDADAIERASERLARFGTRFQALHATYDCLVDLDLAQLGVEGPIVGILMDLGVSSMQLDDVERGFSYSRTAPLDMRMDQRYGESAADLLGRLDVTEIARILRTWGEEKFASRIAQRIVQRREGGDPVQTTSDLSDLIREAIPAPARRSGGHPAKRTFQALRIAVNDELRILERTIPAALSALAVGGRIVVMSYQSLEDRVVKRAFTAGATTSAPPDLPIIPPEDTPYLRLLTRGAEQADEAQVATNPRSAPVRLRAAEKIREPRRLS